VEPYLLHSNKTKKVVSDMFAFKKKKFLLKEKSKELKPETEILGLNTLLQLVLQEEKYETAAIIHSRLKEIELEHPHTKQGHQ